MSLPAWEWVAFDGALPGEPRGAGTALHIGPARWLLVAPGEPWLEELAAAGRRGQGALTDVSGRWVPVEFPADETDGGAAHPLAAAVPLELVLRDRDVAALWAFDCPVLVVRRGGENRRAGRGQLRGEFPRHVGRAMSAAAMHIPTA